MSTNADTSTETGSDRPPRRGVSERELLNELQRLAISYGDVPTESVIDANTEYSLDHYIRRFGNIGQARAEAGVDKLGMALTKGEINPGTLSIVDVTPDLDPDLDTQ